jgi:hypothetical protein
VREFFNSHAWFQQLSFVQHDRELEALPLQCQRQACFDSCKPRPPSAGHAFADALPSSLYANAIVIDWLCAPFIDMDHPPTAETFAAVRRSGITAINFTISAPTYEDTIESLAVLQDLVDRNPDVFLIVRKHPDRRAEGFELEPLCGRELNASPQAKSRP